jgi:predicted nucleic acid-binding protein
MRQATVVVLDACVLYPAPLRDLLMHLALVGLCRARWSDMIHEEWIRVLASRPDLTRSQLERTRKLMDAHAIDCVVSGFERLIPKLNLPDPDDRHVLAAAIHSKASLIVTFNVKDFPATTLRPYKLAARHPDDFIIGLFERHPVGVLEAAANHRRSLKKPPRTVDEYLETLIAQGLPRTVSNLRKRTNVL